MKGVKHVGNFVGGSLIQGYPILGRAGTNGFLSKFDGNHKLANSLLYDDGSNIGIGTTSPSQKLDVSGSVKASSFIVGGTTVIESDGKIDYSRLKGVPTSFTPAVHNHDDRYYTETEMNSFLSGKSDTNHSHSFSSITSKPTTLSGYGITDAYTSSQVDSKIDSKVAGLIGSAPATLDTLNELATALGNDPNFATTIANRIGEVESKVNNSSVSGMSDTVITSPASNQVLVYDSSTSKWKNSDVPLTIASSSVYGSVKVSAGNGLNYSGGLITHSSSAGYKHIPTGGSTGNYLKYSSSGTAVWNTPVLQDLGDTQIIGATNDHLLAFSNGTWRNLSIDYIGLVRGNSSLYVGTSAPSSPAYNAIWIDTN
jgi:hypothetical protein